MAFTTLCTMQPLYSLARRRDGSFLIKKVLDVQGSMGVSADQTTKNVAMLFFFPVCTYER